MAYTQYQVESPSGTIRRTGRVAGTVVPVTYAGSSYSVGAGVTTKACGNKLMKGDLQFSGSSNIPCANKLMPNDIIIRANTTDYENYQVFGASGTFTVPYGVSKIYVCCVGGGGGGAGVNRYSRYGAGGGGGGYVTTGEYNVSPGATYSVSIGNGGAPGHNCYSDEVPSWTTMAEYCKGQNGGTTSVAGLLSASGGGGCAYGYSYGGNGGCGGGSGGTTAVMFWADRDEYTEADWQNGPDGGRETENNRYGYSGYRAVNASSDRWTYNADIQFYGTAGSGQGSTTTFHGTSYGGGGGGGGYAHWSNSYSNNLYWAGAGHQGGGAGATDSYGANDGTANTGGGGGGANGEGDYGVAGSPGRGGTGVVIIYW